jgi:hypothetical protein
VGSHGEEGGVATSSAAVAWWGGQLGNVGVAGASGPSELPSAAARDGGTADRLRESVAR